jgi:hypothetical protein
MPMHQKNLFTYTIAVLLAFAFGIIIAQVLGIPAKDVIVKFFIYTLYGLFVVIYSLRFAFVFLGVFAVYKILRERYYKQMAV